ncbi:ribosome 60S biogenesis N-terminal-domain-containing protein [Irpex rosettiformis]|uniref:Ribosome 60S biogenesis N-terminal-domain-containing protein n=1 Tax=Irpex rosettiformis TaxID=378272 RepID=A0ACB8UF79_9APHY|nr:ribosome 60S biogenesis N-terminal-domain-containing protein [Irpex rosettiformis]
MATANKQTKPTTHTHFTKYEDIRRVLHAQTETAVIEGLTVLRNQLTVKYSENAIPAGDERLLLAKAWLEADNAARGLFDLWGKVNIRQVGLTALILSVLSSLINLLSSQYTYHHLATPIIRDIILPQWSSKLNSYLSTSHNELLLVALKLYNSLSTFAGGKESRAVLDIFPWELKSLPKLLNMRRKSKGNDQVDVLARPDIRTLYVLFLLSFVDSKAPTVVKTAFLEQRRDNFVSIFKGLWQDSYPVVRRVLETCWSGIWADVKIKRTVKINIFAENTVGQIARLYERNEAEDESTESVPADLAHHFLLAICTRPGTGVCFKDQGWYPRNDENEGEGQDTIDDAPRRNHGRIYNKILANVLKTLKVNEDARQQELALRILQVCPELVAGYWPAAALTLEPRLSSKWIANIAFFGSAISLPVPQTTFLLLGGSQLYRPNPPPLSTIMENILPSVNIKVHLSRGLQSSSTLVQHCAALALGKCLTKFGSVLKSMQEVQNALEEDEDGLWSVRRREVEREVLRRVPDFQVIVAFAQQKHAQIPMDVDGKAQDTGAITKAALLSESAQRLLWLYHRYLPQLAAEARFDVTRLLASIHEGVSDDEATTGLVTLRQLHTLRLLNESEEFSIMGKAGTYQSLLYDYLRLKPLCLGPSRSALNTLLALYTGTNTRPIKLAVTELLKRSLSQTLLFQHDADEVDLWLRSIPRGKREPGAKAPDGTPLGDEVAAITLFLEDCVQRCVKTPYRYLQDLQDFWSQHTAENQLTDAQDSVSLPSPLLMTILEQLDAKFTRDLLSPSDCLATVTYIRKLVLRLASKVLDLQPLHALAKRLEALVDKPGPSSVMTAIGREAQYLSVGLKQLERPTLDSGEHNPMVDALLEEIRTEDVPSTLAGQQIRAYELVDRYRLFDGPWDQAQFSQLAYVIQQLDIGAAEDFLGYATLGRGFVWHYIRGTDHPEQFNFETLFLHCSNDSEAREDTGRILIDSVFYQHPTVQDIKRAISLIHHRLSSIHTVLESKGILLLLVGLLERAGSETKAQFGEIARSIWQLPSVASYACGALDPIILPVFKDLIASSKRALDEEPLLQDYVQFWETKLKGDVSTLSRNEIETAITWLLCMDQTCLLSLLDHFHGTGVIHEGNAPVLLEGILHALNQKLYVGDGCISLASRVHQLQDLASLLPGSESARRILSIAIRTSLPLFYDGLLGGHKSDERLSSLTKVAQTRWGAALDRNAEQIDVEKLMQLKDTSPLDITIISAALYKSESARSTVRGLLLANSASSWPLQDVARVLYAYLDTSLGSENIPCEDEEVLSVLYARITSFENDVSIIQDVQHVGIALLSLLPRLPPSFIERIIASLVDVKQEPSSHVFSALADLSSSASEAARKSINRLTERASRWTVTALSSDGPLPRQVHDMMSSVARTIKRFKSLTASSAETLVITAVLHRLQDSTALSLINDVLCTVEMKPVTVNRVLQTVLQHTKFETVARDPGIHSKLVTLLHTLFHLHPKNTCQASHVEPLLTLYGGTMSEADRKLLSIFKLFEKTKYVSIASLLVHWSATPGAPSSTALESVQSFDAARMLRSCLQFPQRISASDEAQAFADGENIYDPFFVILLFARMLGEGAPTTAPGWVQLFRSNVVSLLLRALSAHSDEVRDAALAQMAGLYNVLQDADFQERPHVLYILDLLRDVYAKNTPDQHAPRLPVYITLHLAHALRGVFYPSNFTYPLTARFLLQRPELDTNDMPLLYSMLYSVSDQWRKERAWIVRFMSDGMVGRQEWKILRKRHTWDLLASMFHSEESDLHLRRSILELLANLTCERHAVTSLVLGSAFLSWVELQLESIKQDEGTAWVKILENTLVTLDLQKVQTATQGEWWSIISRCMIALLQSPACSRTVFAYAVRVILRLSALPMASNPQIEDFISLSIKHLAALENALQIPHSADDSSERLVGILCPAPHRSYVLWKAIEADELELWGQCVESLWSATMQVGERSAAWDALTARLLIWRANAGQRSTVGEWARREVVRNISVDFIASV